VSVETIAKQEDVDLAPDGQRWAALCLMLAGTILSPIDFFIVCVAMPSIRIDLGASDGAVQLIVAGYPTAYAVMLVTGGRLGDLYGRKRVFLLGVSGFGLASLVCGMAPDPSWLVAGRMCRGASRRS